MSRMTKSLLAALFIPLVLIEALIWFVGPPPAVAFLAATVIGVTTGPLCARWGRREWPFS